MSRRIRLMSLVSASLFIVGMAHAGPVGDFESALRAAYGDYRSALFQTNAGKPDESAKAIDGFLAQWTTLAGTGTEPPPHYADDPDFAATLTAVADIAEAAGREVAEGKLADAHVTLEGIRDEIGRLHERNGIIGFSDRMNAYHARMEAVIEGGYDGYSPAGLGALREDAAVLAFLAADIAAHPPAEAGDPAYKTVLDGMMASVAALQKAARDGDADAAKAAIGGLKVPYSKLFLKFG